MKDNAQIDYDNLVKVSFIKYLGDKPDFEDFYKWNFKRVKECINKVGDTYLNDQFEVAGIKTTV